jgi:hypothetical protein
MRAVWNSTLHRDPAKQLRRRGWLKRVSDKRVAAAQVPGKTATATAGHGRRESFPPAVAALIDARDPWCVHCGSADGLHRHHRRIKGTGGDPRPHTDCACNGVRLCWLCHSWAHQEGRGDAEAEGLIIPRATAEPRRESVLVHLEADSGGMRKFPTCDGRWLDKQPERRAA